MTGLLNILFVEDEPDVRLITQLAMRADPDIRLWPFDNAVDALTAIVAGVCTFDLALVDANLPGMSGGELIRRIAGLDAVRDLRVVLFTASMARERTEIEAMPSVVGTIEKPFDVTTIHSRIRAFAGRS